MKVSTCSSTFSVIAPRARWALRAMLSAAVGAVALLSIAAAHPPPVAATVTTLVTAPLPTFGLTGDGAGNLYVAPRAITPGAPCPIWRVVGTSLVVVGYVPAFNAARPCLANGIAMDRRGALFVAESASGRIFTFTPNMQSPPTAVVFATVSPGALFIAFDERGSLWVTDGQANLGQVWSIPPTGGVGVEKFRIPPMLNGAGVGRDVRRVPLGTTAGLSVATGIAFKRNGDLYIADQYRQAIWLVHLDRNGEVKSPTGCDTTFTTNTLCLGNIFVMHPMLGAAIAIDTAGNIWCAAIDRNGIAVVNKEGKVTEVFRNPVNGATGLRNAGDLSVGNDHILEFPTSPYFVGRRLCVTNFDSNVQDNSPSGAGELDGITLRGKISCLDQELDSPGLLLPVTHSDLDDDGDD